MPEIAVAGQGQGGPARTCGRNSRQREGPGRDKRP